jgi:hypothetical protein
MNHGSPTISNGFFNSITAASPRTPSARDGNFCRKMVFHLLWRTIMPSEPTCPPRPFRSWNKGKFIGPKSPLTPRYVWSIRARLQWDGKIRDLALFNLAIDSKLRGCDLVALRVDDVAPNGYAASRATVRQRKTGRPVRFEITEQTRQTVDAYLRAQPKMPGHHLFPDAGDRRAH